MVVHCSIEFDDREIGKFYSGEIIIGTVILDLDKPKEVKGIILDVKGFARTSWFENNYGNQFKAFHAVQSDHIPTTTALTNYIGYEKYIAFRKYLLGTEGGDVFVLEKGKIKMKFECLVPANCPTSFEGVQGFVRYFIKITLVRPWMFNQSFKHAFEVVKKLDLNNQSMLVEPAHGEVIKQFGIGLFKSDPLSIIVNLAENKYMPDQKMAIHVQISNESKVSIKKLEINLVMEANLYADSPKHRTYVKRTIVAQVLGHPTRCSSNSEHVYELTVPHGPMSDNESCRIIKIEYFVEVEAKMPTFYSNQIVRVPISIGCTIRANVM